MYLQEGRQIVSPVDAEIAARIDAVGPDGGHRRWPRSTTRSSSTSTTGRWTPTWPTPPIGARWCPASTTCRVAYTALHGVGADVAVAAFERRRLPAAGRGAGPGRRPTPTSRLPFPNPEEPGTLDLLLDEAAAVGADVALANDPDADRLGAVIPTPEGGWRRLSGDEIGWLLADHVLAHTTGDDRLGGHHARVVVAARQDGRGRRRALRRDATPASSGSARRPSTIPSWRFVFGYEQALGYLVTDRPLDKDGITAAVLFAEIAALAKRDGVTLQDRLDDIAERFGRHVTAERSVPVDPLTMAGAHGQAAGQPAGGAGRRGRSPRCRSSPRPTSCGTGVATRPGCRSARAAPSRR